MTRRNGTRIQAEHIIDGWDGHLNVMMKSSVGYVPFIVDLLRWQTAPRSSEGKKRPAEFIGRLTRADPEARPPFSTHTAQGTLSTPNDFSRSSREGLYPVHCIEKPVAHFAMHGGDQAFSPPAAPAQRTSQPSTFMDSENIVPSKHSLPSSTLLALITMVANLTQTLSLLITANHILDYYSVVTGYGHVSVRNPTNNATFFMTGNGQPPALVRSPEDLDEFYLEDASPATERSSQPMDTSERFIHQGLLKRFPNIQREEAPVFEIADYYAPNDTQDLLVNKVRFGEALANTFLTSAHNASAADLLEPDHNLVLQRGHGFTTVGTSIPEAVYRAVYTTWNAEVQASAITINDAAGNNRGVRYIAQQELPDTLTLDDKAYPRDWLLWAAQVGVNPLYKNDLGHASIPEPQSG
ncbi:MAG: hypothetical protein Q9186_002878 [Xanthomendoza sp. 1 TL-2023]